MDRKTLVTTYNLSGSQLNWLINNGYIEQIAKQCPTRKIYSYNILKSWDNIDIEQYRITHCVVCGRELSSWKIYQGKICCCISCGNKYYYSNLTEERKQELRKKNSIAVTAAFQRPEVKKKLSDVSRASWANASEERRQKASITFSNTLKELWKTEEYRKDKSDFISKTNIQLWQNEEYRQKQKISHKNVWKNEDLKQYHSKQTSIGTLKAYKANHDAIIEKIYLTKKKNHSFNSSSIEQYVKDLMQQVFPDIQYQYYSEKYPYNCDFYIPSLDLYIEYNGTWTHGGKPFNETDESCIEQLNKWKEKAKTSKFYQNAIDTWTIRDVRKRQCAIDNNLNWLCFYSVKEVEEFLLGITKGDNNVNTI